MKLLFDLNISFRLLNKINDIFPDSAQVRSIGLENKSDIQIWDFAKVENFTIVTFDADFYDFSIMWRSPPKIIWLRFANQKTSEIDKSLRKHHATILEFIQTKELDCLKIH